MTSQHLNFEQLSDLFDDEVTEAERKFYTFHLNECSICRKEYESLCICLSMLKDSRGGCRCIPDICSDTINAYRARERKKQYLKSFPAIAASVIIITGVGFLHTTQYVNERALFSTQVSTRSDFQRIIDSIRDSNGNILNITAAYIDGEIPKNDLARLERILHYFRIKHTVLHNNIETEKFAARNIDIEDVSFSTNTLAGSSMFGRGNSFITKDSESDKIRVRIFK